MIRAAVLFAAAALGAIAVSSAPTGATTPAAGAARCRDAHGHFTRCPAAAVAPAPVTAPATPAPIAAPPPRAPTPVRTTRTRATTSTVSTAGASCSCASHVICTGPRGGHYCITSGGNRRYVH